jgi:hypothetical protein
MQQQQTNINRGSGTGQISMDLNPHSHGRVAWSENPMDTDPLSAQQGSDMPADFDLMPSTWRAVRLKDTPRNRHGFQSGLCHLRPPACPDAEPEMLRQAWAHWYASNQDPHGHHRVATGLRIKEVQLLRALQGDSVHALHADLAKLLGQIGSWGRVVVELHHPLGLALVSLEPEQVRVTPGQLLLIDPERQFALGTLAFAECFLVHTAGAFSLHGFDEAGDVVARVHLIDLARHSPTHRRALQHLLGHAVAHDAGAARSAKPIQTGDRITQPGWCRVEQQVRGPETLAQLCRQLGMVLNAPQELNFMMESEAAILALHATCIHRVNARSTAPQHVRHCKLYLRPAHVRQASVCAGSDERVFLRLSANYGHCLRFQHPGTQAEARGWIESLMGVKS